MMSLFITGSFKCDKLIICVLVHSLQLVNEVHLAHGVLLTGTFLIIKLIEIFIVIRDNNQFLSVVRHANVGRAVLLFHGDRAGFLNGLIDN
jgi:hypothetical protein